MNELSQNPFTKFAVSQRLLHSITWIVHGLLASFLLLGLANSVEAKSAVLSNLSLTEETALYRWMADMQDKSPVGILESYPDDPDDGTEPRVKDTAFTYDQALAGIVFLHRGDLVRAQKIFHFFDTRADQSGFFSCYHVKTGGIGPVEISKRTGPNVWLGIFALNYYIYTGDEEAYQLARRIVLWTMSLPHVQGGVVIFPGHFAVSTENNLSYMAFLEKMAVLARMKFNDPLATTIENELAGVKGFLKTQVFNNATGLFNRGYHDPKQVLDTNSWFFLAVTSLDSIENDPRKSDNSDRWGLKIDRLIDRIEETFAVQPDGSFDGRIYKARGFDFSDADNAFARGGAVSWIEGTSQMIVVYKQLSGWYSGKSSRSALYAKKAEIFFAKNKARMMNLCEKSGFSYTDAAGTIQAYNDDPYFYTATGPSVASAAWMFFASRGVNPLLAPVDFNSSNAATLAEQCCALNNFCPAN